MCFTGINQSCPCCSADGHGKKCLLFCPALSIMGDKDNLTILLFVVVGISNRNNVGIRAE